jgi:hypothetical protein
LLPDSDPPLAEDASWLTAEILEDVLVESLDPRPLHLSDLQGWSEEVRLRAVLEHPGDWLAVVREDYTFDRLIDRRQALEQLGKHTLSR